VLRYGRADLQALKAYKWLGACHRRLGNLSSALHYYDVALALGEDEPYTRCYRGMIHYARGDHAATLIDLEVAEAEGTDYLHQNRDVWEPAARYLHELRQRLC
jgi:tetratricopeptide (TPR) repeat protein